MKREAIKDYYILNGEKCSTEQMEVFDGIHGPSIYEVIRLIEGVPLFLEEHLERMRKSASLLGYEIYKTDGEITREIQELAQINHIQNLNVKLVCSDLEKKDQIFITYFIETHYPSQELYEEGIRTILYSSERLNPNAKTINTSFKDSVNTAIKEAKAYEALLVNHEGYITEGSRSNMFFVKENKIYTAPTGDVLMGVTRTEIMKVCRALRIEVEESCVHTKDLEKIDGAFMTGTSVNVLPISQIEDKTYASVKNPIIQKIAQGYLKEMEAYLRKNARK